MVRYVWFSTIHNKRDLYYILQCVVSINNALFSLLKNSAKIHYMRI